MEPIDVITPEQAELVHRTSDVLLDVDAGLARSFYDVLFGSHPEVRPLFPADMSEQMLKLTDMLATIIGSLRHPDVFRSTTLHLGQRHARYGVTLPHYDVMAEALMASLRDALGSRFTPEVESAWRSLYDAMAAGMKAGMIAR